MEFKDIIKGLREKNGFTLTQFASLFDKSEAAIRAWETGRSKPDVDTLINISKYFHVPTDYLLGLISCIEPANVKTNKELGLSEEAIETIKDINERDNDPTIVKMIDILNRLIFDDDFNFAIVCTQLFLNNSEESLNSSVAEIRELEQRLPNLTFGEYLKSMSEYNFKLAFTRLFVKEKWSKAK